MHHTDVALTERKRGEPTRPLRIDGGTGEPHPDRVRRRREVIFPFEPIVTLLGAPAAEGNQLAQLRVGGVGRGEERETIAFGEAKMTPDQELDTALGRGFIGAYDAGECAFVGDGHRRVAELLGALYQLARMACPALEGEVATTQYLRVGHANHSHPQLDPDTRVGQEGMASGRSRTRNRVQAAESRT